MDKKEIQRQRMMKYFIDAAKKIIQEEGIQALTVRKVGDKAGYSYATIYNYFHDLNTLLLYCVFDFLEDCYEHISSVKNDAEDCREQLILFASAYFKYFASRPDIFHLIFVEDLGNPPNDLGTSSYKPSVGLFLQEALTACAKKGYIAEEKVEMLQELLVSSMHGKLLFFLKGRHAGNLDAMMRSIRDEIEFLIQQN